MPESFSHAQATGTAAPQWSLVLCLTISAACSPTTPAAPTAPGLPPPSTFAVSSITDGDTLRFSPALEGTTTLRMLNIDAPESAQAPWEEAASTALFQLAPPSTELTIETDQVRLDSFGRVLGHVFRRNGLNLNREQLRGGHAVLFVIWPNISRYEDYRAAQIEAQTSQRGIWDPARPLGELPFEYRLRIDGDAPFRPVGDFFTRQYVEPADYRRVHVNNRVFFNARSDAASAGYQPCPREAAGGYSAQCFAPGQ
jgi:endonuclease YncB( thermonuclease family)